MRYDIYNGLDPAEISLLEVAGSKDDVLLVIDEKVAKAEGFDYTGTLGVIVYGVKSGVISGSEGRKMISSLSRSDFRMTVALYDWAIKRIEDL